MSSIVRLFAFAGLLFGLQIVRAADALDEWQWRIPQPQGNDLNDIAFGNGVYVAVGEHASIVISTNGTDWESHGLEVVSRLEAVTFGNGRFVAVGRMSDLSPQVYILVSSNGVHWSEASTYSSKTNGVLMDVVFGAGKFMAVGNRWHELGALLLISNDGSNWTEPSTNAPWSDTVAYGAGRFVVGAGDAFYSSTNGWNWDGPQTLGNNIDEVHLGFVNGRFLAVGFIDDYLDSGYNAPAFASSTNGLDWSVGTIVNFTTYDSVDVRGVGFINNRYFAVGSIDDMPAAWISTNGETWSVSWPPLFNATPLGLLNDNGKLIAVGEAGLISSSSDGTNWSAHAGPFPEKCSAVTYGNGLFVGVGYDGSVQTSRDGVHWNSRTVVPGHFWIDITFGDNRFVGVSASGRVLTSTDGANWTVQWPTNFNFIQFAKVIHGGGKFVIVGNASVSSSPYSSFGIVSSTDGVTWTNAIRGSGFDLDGITYGDGKYVAVGGWGTTMISSNAIDWTTNIADTRAFFRSVAFGNGTFVASGAWNQGSVSYPLLFYSTNGVNWTATSAPAPVTYYTLDRVAYGNGVFITVSDRVIDSGGMIFTSFNGRQWQQRHSPISQDLTGIAAGEGTFVLVGPSGVVLQSSDLRPRLHFNHHVSGMYQLTLNGLSNVTYQTEFSTNLVDWTRGWTNQVNAPEVMVFQTNSTISKYFYRAVSQ